MPQWLHTRVARKEDPRDLNSFENSRFGAMTVYHCLFTGGVCGDPWQRREWKARCICTLVFPLEFVLVKVCVCMPECLYMCAWLQTEAPTHTLTQPNIEAHTYTDKTCADTIHIYTHVYKYVYQCCQKMRKMLYWILISNSQQSLSVIMFQMSHNVYLS